MFPLISPHLTPMLKKKKDGYVCTQNPVCTVPQQNVSVFISKLTFDCPLFCAKS